MNEKCRENTFWTAKNRAERRKKQCGDIDEKRKFDICGACRST